MENPIEIHDLGVPLFLETPRVLMDLAEILSVGLGGETCWQ